MARRHADEAELVLQELMAPAVAFAKALQDPDRAAAFESLSAIELFKLVVCACSLLPRVQQAERLARGCKVVYSSGVSSPGSPQGPSEWRISVYAPPRKELTPEDIAP